MDTGARPPGHDRWTLAQTIARTRWVGLMNRERKNRARSEQDQTQTNAPAVKRNRRAERYGFSFGGRKVKRRWRGVRAR